MLNPMRKCPPKSDYGFSVNVYVVFSDGSRSIGFRDYQLGGWWVWDGNVTCKLAKFSSDKSIKAIGWAETAEGRKS